MKIVQALGWYFPDSLGGTEVYVAGLSRRLREAGHDVMVAAPDARHGDVRNYEHDGIPVHRYPIPPAPTREECQGIAPVRGTERLHAWLAKQCPDVVHVHTVVTGLGLAELKIAKAIGARVIVTTHASSLGYICQRGTMMRWGERLCDGVCEAAKCAACALQHRGLPRAVACGVARTPAALSRLAARLPGKPGTALGMRDLILRNQASQRELMSAVDRFVLLTRWAFDVVAANGAPRERLALNRLGVSQSGTERKPSPKERPTRAPIRIGYLGRLDPIKGVHDLARALAHLPSTLAVRAEFRGPSNGLEDERNLHELRRLVGPDRRVTFAPPVPAADVVGVLASYDVLCCPAVCVEGGPTVALEAYAVGTPVIGTRIGGLAELVSDGRNGRLVAPGDWRALAGVLRETAEDPAGTIDRWRQALPPVRTMDEIAHDYLALYTE